MLYVRVVRGVAAFLGGPPDTATAEDIRRFQVHQREGGVQPPTINGSVPALRFFFTATLDRPDLSRRLVLARYPRKLPAALSVEGVGRLLGEAPGIKYKAILGAAYSRSRRRQSNHCGYPRSEIDEHGSALFRGRGSARARAKADGWNRPDDKTEQTMKGGVYNCRRKSVRREARFG